MPHRVAEGLSPVIDLLFPPRCPACGDAIGVTGGLCVACWDGLEIPSGPACQSCQLPFPDHAGDDADTICAHCADHPPPHDGIAAATLYGDVSRGSWCWPSSMVAGSR